MIDTKQLFAIKPFKHSEIAPRNNANPSRNKITETAKRLEISECFLAENCTPVEVAHAIDNLRRRGNNKKQFMQRKVEGGVMVYRIGPKIKPEERLL